MENLRHKILVTAFDAFGGERVNPSALVLEQLPDETDTATIVKRLLPTSYIRAPKEIKLAVEKEAPDFVLMLGQAGGRNGVTPERVAINCMDASAPDNDGTVYRDTAIDPDGKEAYFAALPVTSLAESLRAAGIPAYVSNSAGTFVCNRVMYEALAVTSGTKTKAGFVHIPYIPEQTADKKDPPPSLPFEESLRAINIIIKELTRSD